jgi:transcription factor IIIB subunit 2
MISVFSSINDTHYQPVCTDCGGTIIEYDQAAGNGFCVKCGTVIEENTIVNEIAFGETSSGAAMVQGSFVAQGASTFVLSSLWFRNFLMTS